MKLINYLNSVIENNIGYVQVQLAKEDIGRIEKLRELARICDDLKSMQKAGLYIGWTKGDFRTHELSIPLKALIAAIYDYESDKDKSIDSVDQDEKIMEIWAKFHTQRLKTLVHCL